MSQDNSDMHTDQEFPLAENPFVDPQQNSASPASYNSAKDAATKDANIRHRSYVRPSNPHRTVDPVDDLAVDDAYAHAGHDSNYTAHTNSPLSGRAYRKSRNEMPQLRHDLPYGQYLSIPKGRRTIFSAHERRSRIGSAVITVLVVTGLAVLVAIRWHLIGHTAA